MPSSITHVVSDLPRLPTNSGGYVYIACNDAGVDFVGYATAANLAVQVTELNDDVFDGCTVNHAVTDGTSFWNFFNTFAKRSFARLPDFSRSSVLISPAVIRLKEGGPRFTFNVDKPLKERIFSFSKEAIQKLQARTNSNKKNKKWIETVNDAVEILGKQRNDPYQKKGRVTAIIENRLKLAVSKPPEITSSTDDDVRKTKRTTQLPCSKTITMSTLLCIVSLVALIPPLAEARSTPGHFPGGSWQGAHSAFNGSREVSGPMGGTGRKENVKSQGYGGDTAAIFNDRLRCGPCSSIKCANGPHSCTSIFVTATNFVAATDFSLQNDVKHNDNEDWCNSPHRSQFHLAMPMFDNNDENRPAFNFKYFNLVLIANVACAGDDRVRVSVKGTRTGWMPLSRSWGENRQMNAVLVGQSLSFRVTGGDGRTSTFPNVVPSTWQLDQTTDGKNTKQVPYRKLLSSFHSLPAGIKHTRPIHAFKLYWRSGPGFGIQSLPSEVQGPESAAPAPARY